ncbi:DUF1679 domain-containing protein [Salinimonas marina]|uniref:DUF1679 domain-containing protein n=1 Tax=Salinimonas marina TaxID=2785918 RepID=A0A7S9DVF6_9ALTE|nr:phosphotransferase [Salinimonas marina]QPG04473.1 DUF1679 domain-containing protein [Salinimonas marina]
MSESVNPKLVHYVSQLLDDPSISDCQLLQTLWSGYGQCFRFHSQQYDLSLVAKVVTPSTTPGHPKGWSNDQSHQRKLQSYAVEQYFYQHYAPMCHASVPALIAGTRHHDDFITVLEDLDAQHFRHRHTNLTVTQCEGVLNWLALFHADFIEIAPTGLWKQGAYWHLSTRQAEFEAMAEGPLKTAAKGIDEVLQQASIKTLLHGDAKVANFCFADDPREVAAVDFQYTGAGVGVIDVAYFLGSALSAQDQLHYSQQCLDVYFTALSKALTQRGYDSQPVVKQWRQLYPFACADFLRFLQGWSPVHWKINRYLTEQSQQALSLLKG